MTLPYFESLTPDGIWNISQNKPSLIAKDLELLGVPRPVTHAILLARGVYKWLSVRRDLIILKNTWKECITGTLQRIRMAKIPDNAYEVGYLRGYLKAYEECRAEIRALCHSARWRAPDYDREAAAFLSSISVKTNIQTEEKG
jgi:hypothetical protein